MTRATAAANIQHNPSHHRSDEKQRLKKKNHANFFLAPYSECKAAAEDVAHIIVHVHTVLPLTSDLTNSQTHRKATLQTPHQVHSQILLRLSPCTPTTLRRFMRKRLACRNVWKRSLVEQLLCKLFINSVFVYLPPQISKICLMTRTSSETNMSSPGWWMIFTLLLTTSFLWKANQPFTV